MIHDFQIDALSKNWIVELQGDPEARHLARVWIADAKAGEERDAREEAARRRNPSFARRTWRWVAG